DNHFLDDPGLYDSCCCHLCSSSSSSISSASSSTAIWRAGGRRLRQIFSASLPRYLRPTGQEVGRWLGRTALTLPPTLSSVKLCPSTLSTARPDSCVPSCLSPHHRWCLFSPQFHHLPYPHSKEIAHQPAQLHSSISGIPIKRKSLLASTHQQSVRLLAARLQSGRITLSSGWAALAPPSAVSPRFDASPTVASDSYQLRGGLEPGCHVCEVRLTGFRLSYRVRVWLMHIFNS
ncbi:unnamed protein product, partial [Protopolystoma xenopodis]